MNTKTAVLKTRAIALTQPKWWLTRKTIWKIEVNSRLVLRLKVVLETGELAIRVTLTSALFNLTLYKINSLRKVLEQGQEISLNNWQWPKSSAKFRPLSATQPSLTPFWEAHLKQGMIHLDDKRAKFHPALSRNYFINVHLAKNSLWILHLNSKTNLLMKKKKTGIKEERKELLEKISSLNCLKYSKFLLIKDPLHWFKITNIICQVLTLNEMKTLSASLEDLALIWNRKLWK